MNNNRRQTLNSIKKQMEDLRDQLEAVKVEDGQDNTGLNSAAELLEDVISYLGEAVEK